MSANYEFNLPVFVANAGVATSGHTKDLVSGQVSIFDRQTWNVATPTGNGKEFFLAMGSYHTKDNLTKFFAGMQRSLKSYFFRGQDIISFEVSTPQRIQNEEWVIGYDGTVAPNAYGVSSAVNNFVYQCGTDYQLRITLYGEPVYRVFGKTLEHVVSYTTAPCADPSCTTGCIGPLGVIANTRAYADAITNHPELKLLGVRAKAVISSYTAPVAQATVTVALVATTVASIQILDGGGQYTGTPTVAITGGGGTGATATATVTNGVISAFTITAAGSGFTSSPTVTLSGGTGANTVPATVRAVLTAAAVNTTSSGLVGGAGYIATPTVTIASNNGSGTGAAATATLTTGAVSAITISSGGSGYTGTVTATITGPETLQNLNQIAVYDDGSSQAQAQIQVAIGNTYRINRISYTGGQSIYQVYTPSSVTLASYTPTSAVPLTTTITGVGCTTCPTGYTLTAGKDVYVVQRPLLPTDNVSTAGARLTYAQAIATAYSTSTADASYLSTMNGDLAQVIIKVNPGVIPTPTVADIFIKQASEGAFCTPTASIAAVSWTVVGTAYASARQEFIVVDRPQCNPSADRLTDVTAFVAQFPNYVTGSIAKTAGTACADIYTITRIADGQQTDSCLSYDTATWSQFPAFEGRTWLPTVTTPDAYLSTVYAGIRISAGYIDTVFNDCSFDPRDYYNTAPIQLDLAWIVDFPNAPDIATFPTPRKTQIAQFSRQSGEWVIRELIAASVYMPFGYDEQDPRMREVMDVQLRAQVDRKAFYKVYYLRYQTARGFQNFGQKSEVMETPIIFKEDDPRAKTFEATIEGITSKFNVTLQSR